MIVRKFSESEVCDILAIPPFFRVLDLLALGGEETVDGGGRLHGEDVIAGEDTDGLVIVLDIEKEEGDLEEMKEYIADGSAVSERISEGWMTFLTCTSVADWFLVFSCVLPISE